MTYQEIKNKFTENKQKIVVVICFLLVFVIGFGTGRYNREARNPNNKSYTDYTTKPVDKPEPAVQTAKPLPEDKPAPEVKSASTQSGGNCVIKGNISAKGGKIYHVPGGASYKVTKAEQCFNTETEAQAAGYKKASR